MVTAPRQSTPPQPLADDGSNNLLLEVGRTIRDNFHTLIGLSLIYLIIALPCVVLATMTSWTIVWAPLVFATSPIWAIIIACADRMLIAEATPPRTLIRDLRRFGWPAFRVGAVPALVGSTLLALASSPTRTSAAAIALMLGIGVAGAIGLLVIPAIPLAIRHELTGIRLWQTSAWVVTRRPTQVLGTATLAGIGIWLAMMFGPAVLLGAAPLGVLVAAITLPDPE